MQATPSDSTWCEAENPLWLDQDVLDHLWYLRELQGTRYRQVFCGSQAANGRYQETLKKARIRWANSERGKAYIKEYRSRPEVKKRTLEACRKWRKDPANRAKEAAYRRRPERLEHKRQYNRARRAVGRGQASWIPGRAPGEL